MLAQAFLPLVAKSGKKTIVNVSSTLGSIGTDFGKIAASYSVAKAGLNMLVRHSPPRHYLSSTVCFVLAWLTWTLVDAPLLPRADVEAGEGTPRHHRDRHVPWAPPDR